MKGSVIDYRTSWNIKHFVYFASVLDPTGVQKTKTNQALKRQRHRQMQ